MQGFALAEATVVIPADERTAVVNPPLPRNAPKSDAGFSVMRTVAQYETVAPGEVGTLVVVLAWIVTVLVYPPLAAASMHPLSKLVEAVVATVDGHAVAVPAGEPHHTLEDPQVCEPGEYVSAALITADAAASAALCAASRRK
jgi:hypothetical protein